MRTPFLISLATVAVATASSLPPTKTPEVAKLPLRKRPVVMPEEDVSKVARLNSDNPAATKDESPAVVVDLSRFPQTEIQMIKKIMSDKVVSDTLDLEGYTDQIARHLERRMMAGLGSMPSIPRSSISLIVADLGKTETAIEPAPRMIPKTSRVSTILGDIIIELGGQTASNITVGASNTADIRFRLPSPRDLFDKLPPIAREYVHQVFSVHGNGVCSSGFICSWKRIESDIGIPKVRKILRWYHLSLYTLGYVHTEAFDYLIGGNGRRCLETPTSRLSDELNQLEYPSQRTMYTPTRVAVSTYTAARVAFWCNDIMEYKSAEELLAFRDSHASVPTGFVQLTHEEYSALLMSKLRTSFSTRIITPQEVVAAMTT